MGTIYAGTSGWAYTNWKPVFYPRNLSTSQFLAYYATCLNSVEVNYTFSNPVGRKMVDDWIRSTPQDFVFAVKANQEITHFKRLRGATRSTKKFLSSLQALEGSGKLGPVFFQLPPNFKCDVRRLRTFLSYLPHKSRIAFEFRHPSWFDDDVYGLLRGSNIALCFAESDKLVTPEISTADFSYLRLRKSRYSAPVRAKLAERIRKLAHFGDVFVYFKHDNRPDGARYAEALLKPA